MGVDLSSLYKKNCWHFSWGGWTEVLKVAFENGWKPRGTEAPSWVEGDGTPTQLWSIQRNGVGAISRTWVST
jgi:hypothetical protein